MCGRFTLDASPEDLQIHFGLAQPPTIAARYNIAPLQTVPVVALKADRLRRGAGEPDTFLAAYAENQASAREQALDASPLSSALVRVLEGEDEWEGTPSDLLRLLDTVAPDPRPGIGRDAPTP